ncbi:MAG TPA: acetyl-CoA carboxylase biotin carboxyl carrier protein subunit [Rhizomicrobium sp.]|nr:acetyl-CoA carboxylase biotin carboxyl carrier protein subunit [Rhizomicrobium sp.]
MREVFRVGEEEHALHPGEDVGDLAVSVATQGDRLFIHLDGQTYELDYLPAVRRHAQDAALSASDHLVAPMPGAVVACAVKPGDAVAAGDLLLVIESMKLEMPFKAWRDGRVASVHVTQGQTFERDKVLLSLGAA